ncbi:PDR/VanB family oxidoreductase [Saccharopolyspora sp. CA-218241]|uniref:PDR/VanB family oxidoreductase n=1 Tax=Saccharopolyspora sp. CA-218241 TaxID=3240027 RepID=UPI003D98AEFF
MTPTVAVRVSEVTEEATGVRSLRLVAANGSSLGPYEAGAHVDVVGPTGVLRQYSLCSRPDDPASRLIAVKREPESRGGSAALHDVRVGDVLEIGAPRNLLTVAADADRHLLVAGGIGITPLLSMAYELHRRGAEFTLDYFARSRSEAAFADLLEHRVEFRDRVHLHWGVPRADRPAVLEERAGALTPSSHVYTCGPDGFMAQVGATLGPVVGEDHVHVEHFVAAEVDRTADTAFTVELDTGEEFEVPADRSILSVLGDNGVEVFKSCEEGVCGSCVSGVLEGIPDHRDSCLSRADRAANDQLALCVSRARTARLKIELY